MTSTQIVQFSPPPPPLIHLRAKFFHIFDFRRTISNEPPAPPYPNGNQSFKRKHRLRMTITCYQKSNDRVIHDPQ